MVIYIFHFKMTSFKNNLFFWKHLNQFRNFTYSLSLLYYWGILFPTKFNHQRYTNDLVIAKQTDVLTTPFFHSVERSILALSVVGRKSKSWLIYYIKWIDCFFFLLCDTSYIKLGTKIHLPKAGMLETGMPAADMLFICKSMLLPDFVSV